MADRFDTTRWSLILQARGEGATALSALESLCRTYRPPVLAYVRAHRRHRADAEDITQAFFAHLLENRLAARADPERGRFRAFLQTSLRNFLASERQYTAALRRGGEAQRISLDEIDLPANEYDDPERAFDREWARAVLGEAMRRLATEADKAGRGQLFSTLRPFLVESPEDKDYARVAEQLQLRRNTVAVAIHRLRSRLQELVREVVADASIQTEDVEHELRRLRASLSLTPSG